MTEEVAREALRSFVSSKCCYGSSAAGDLIIQELRQQTLCRVGEPLVGAPALAASGLHVVACVGVKWETAVWGEQCLSVVVTLRALLPLLWSVALRSNARSNYYQSSLGGWMGWAEWKEQDMGLSKSSQLVRLPPVRGGIGSPERRSDLPKTRSLK